MSELDFPVLDEGRADQLPVVFLHAFPYHSGMWSEQRAALRGRARFIAFDARGLGQRGSTGAYMLEHTVDDLLRVLDHLSIPSCVLCGVSMGGYAALRAVQRAQERVRGLMLVDTQAASDSDAAKLARAEAVSALRQHGTNAFADAQLRRQLSPYTLENKPILVEQLRTMIIESSSEGIAASLVAIATRTDSSASLAEIRVPTRVVVGADDTITPVAVAETMARSIPDARLHVLERAGHLANIEAPEAFNRVLLEFLAAF